MNVGFYAENHCHLEKFHSLPRMLKWKNQIKIKSNYVLGYIFSLDPESETLFSRLPSKFTIFGVHIGNVLISWVTVSLVLSRVLDQK